jgi:hypothetical protein
MESFLLSLHLWNATHRKAAARQLSCGAGGAHVVPTNADEAGSIGYQSPLSHLASGADVWTQPPRFDSSLERIMGLFFKKISSAVKPGIMRLFFKKIPSAVKPGFGVF